MPERLMSADPDFFISKKLSKTAQGLSFFGKEALAEYMRCFRNPETVRGMCEDYRAGATVDRELDEADRADGRQIGCPTLALWGTRGALPVFYDDVLAVWRDWAPSLRGRGVEASHFLPEDAPEEVAAELAGFFAIDGATPSG